MAESDTENRSLAKLAETHIINSVEKTRSRPGHFRVLTTTIHEYLRFHKFVALRI